MTPMTKSISNLFASALAALLLTGAAAFASVETGAAAPDFTLTDTNGKTHSLSDFKGKYVILEWTNHACPFVVKHYVQGAMPSLQKEYTSKGAVWLTINSTNSTHQDYQTPEQANEWLKKHDAACTAMLLDPESNVARAYDAKTTPHIFIIDPEGKVVYQGAIDSIRSAKPEDVAAADNYVKLAMNELLEGKPVSNATTRPYGCSVKYK